jgi:prephenate dehydrogenase
MGGSMAKSLKKLYKDIEIIGYDHHKSNESEALKLGFIDKRASYEEILSSDIIILAIPVDGIVSFLKEIKELRKDQTIIDLGSTKAKIISNTPANIRKNLVATHPMAGTEKSGPGAAIDDLYSGKVVVFCDIDESGEEQKEVATKLFRDLGMSIVYMDSISHDRDAAYISHLPHALSFALANTVLKQEDPKSILALAGGGFKDMSRIAKSSPSMWVEIFSQNRENLLTTIEDFQKELSILKEQVQKKDWDSLALLIQEANKLHKIL